METKKRNVNSSKEKLKKKSKTKTSKKKKNKKPLETMNNLKTSLINYQQSTNNLLNKNKFEENSN